MKIDLNSTLMDKPSDTQLYQHRFLPFLLVVGGVTTDYLTTKIGLTMGFYEVHAHYQPILAFLIFFSAIASLTLLLPKKKEWQLSIIGVALTSYFGVVNNTLVMLGLFNGLPV